jgi:hypothetical protein
MAITSPHLRALPAREAARPGLAAPPFWLWSLALALLAAAALLWPLPARIHSHALDTGDGLHLAWTLRYAQQALLNPAGGFAAPAAFPYDAGLLLNPPLYALALLTLPLLALGWSATAVYNSAILLSFALSCWSVALLGRRLAGNGLAGVAAGLIYAFADVRVAHLAHLNLLSGFWTALLLNVLLIAWREPPRSRRGLAGLAVGAGLLAAAQALSDIYNAIYMVAAVGLLASFWAGQLLWQWRSGARAVVGAALPALGALAVGALLAAALVAPVLLPTLGAWRELGVARSWADHEALSAAPAHYGAAAYERPFYNLTDLRGREIDSVEQRLWPGAAALGLATLGLLAGRERRRERLFMGALAALALTLSLGPRLQLGEQALTLPWYRWLFDHAPLFGAARVPARWALLLQLALAGLAAVGAARLMSLVAARLPRRPLARAALALGLLALLIADVRPGPLPTTAKVVSEPLPAVYRALAGLPEGALLEWPLENASATLKHRQQFYTLAHGRPIVNAAASAPPPRFAAVHAYLRAFPGGGTVGFLRDLGVRYVVVSRWEIGDWATLEPRLAAAPGLQLAGEYEDGRHLLYEVLPEQPAPPAPLAVVVPGARLHLQLAAPLWLDAPARLYRGERATPVRLHLADGGEVAISLSLPPVLLPGGHAWDLPAEAAGAESLVLGGHRLAVSHPPAGAGTGERPWLAAAALPAQLAPGDALPCLAFGHMPRRPGLVLAAAMVDGGWNVAAKIDHMLDLAPGEASPVALPCGLTLPPDLAPGSYRLALGLYDPAASAFVPVEGPGGAWSEGLMLLGEPIAVAR